jgi:carbamoyl-phosphate synthase large subunit
MALDRHQAIAISGINATDNPGPGVPVAKCLRLACRPGPIIGLGYEPNDPGHYLRQYFDDSALMTFPGQGWEAYHARLLQLRDRHGLGLVIPCLDAELPLYIRFQDELAREGLRTFLPTEDQFRLRNKEHLADLAPRIGAKHPRTWRIQSVADLAAAWKECPLPAFIKGPYYKAYRVSHWDDAVHHMAALSAEWGWPILLQEAVFGDELNVVGVGDGAGGNLGLVAIKKLTTTHLGKIWSGVTIEHARLLAVCAEFIRFTRWRGPFELECIDTGADIQLIEINPRFPAWVGFSAGVGVNLPDRLVGHLRGETVATHSNYTPGRLFMRYTDEIVTDLSHFQQLLAR